MSDTQRAWVWLLVAGALEVGWAVGLKLSDGFRRPVISTCTAVMMIASYYFLAQALKALPLGTAYAIWTGIGAVGTAVVGMLVLGESRDAWRVVSIGVIVLGIAGLKVASGRE